MYIHKTILLFWAGEHHSNSVFCNKIYTGYTLIDNGPQCKVYRLANLILIQYNLNPNFTNDNVLLLYYHDIMHIFCIEIKTVSPKCIS